jgi:two-component sensor histidine kinase
MPLLLINQSATLFVVLAVALAVGGAILAMRFREPTHREMQEFERRVNDRLQAIERKLELLAERTESRSDGRP